MPFSCHVIRDNALPLRHFCECTAGNLHADIIEWTIFLLRLTSAEERYRRDIGLTTIADELHRG